MVKNLLSDSDFFFLAVIGVCESDAFVKHVQLSLPLFLSCFLFLSLSQYETYQLLFRNVGNVW